MNNDMINKIVLRRESYMKNERNRTIDFFRAIAILSVLFYHFYYLCNYPYQSVPVIHRILSSGGEIGVTLFFIISGYGICGSLMRMEQTDGSVSWKKFMKKRFVRILPQYYGSIIVLLLITSNSSYMNKKGLFDIGTHLLFIHNWFRSTHGSISSVLWTMGTIFQFYIIAVWVYKCFKKNPYAVCIASMILSIGLKALFYHILVPEMNIDAFGNFVYARQVFTALDNFVLGMLLYWVLTKYKFKLRKIYALLGIIAVLGVCYKWNHLIDFHSPYGDDWWGYIWHTVFAVILTVLIYLCSQLNIQFKHIPGRIILWISKYQYGTYIWHFIIAVSLLSNSSAAQVIARNSYIVFCVVMGGICLFAGYFSTIIFESVNYIEEIKKIKNYII